MKRLVALSICLVLLASTGCSQMERQLRPQSAGAQELPAKGDPTAKVDPRLATANNTFGFRLLREMDGDPSRNTLLSPFSVTSALAMTANGADGEALKSMERVLFQDSLPLPDANTAYADLLSRLQTDTAVAKLAVANSLWLREGATFRPDFLAANRDYYAAESTTTPFGGPEANQRIDAWVNDRTRGLIPELYGKTPIDKDTLIVLVNALYFKADWKDSFDPSDTRDETFTPGRDEATFKVPMMSQKGEFDYLGTKDFDAVRLPYRNGKQAMYVFVPKGTAGLDGFLEKLDGKTWDEWMRGFAGGGEVIVGLPKMKLKTHVPLDDELRKLGMGPAFVSGFERIATSPVAGGPVRITDVVHAVTVLVDEKGTEAAAATGVTVAMGAAAPMTRVWADRPFFFAIRDEGSGAVLFAGAVRDPRQ